MNVFLLDTDDRYLWIGLVNEDDWDTFLDHPAGTPFGRSWKPLEAEVIRETAKDARLSAGDFPYFASDIPAFSKAAVDVLKPMLVANGELLPLRCEEGEYYAYNVTNLTDALDKDQSEFSYLAGAFVGVKRPAFDPNKLAGLTIFKLREDPRGRTYVTDVFVKCVRQAKLVGFKFKKVWPASPKKPAKSKQRKPPAKPPRAKVKRNRPLTRSEQRELDEQLALVRQALGIAGTKATPDEVQQRIDKEIVRVRKGQGCAVGESRKEIAVALGALWGQSVCDQLGWRWAQITLDKDKAIGIISPRQELVIFPFHYIYQQLSPDVEPTSLLQYNMLKAGSISAPDNAYEVLG